ncbi:MAG: hypothetical protein ABJN34_12670 [Litoreibacter sp.]
MRLGTVGIGVAVSLGCVSSAFGQSEFEAPLCEAAKTAASGQTVS